MTLFVILSICRVKAQENYEIQVYGSETTEKGRTMVELHSNFTFDGSTTITDGLLPSNHVFHETIEITHGWNSWFETGFYIFNEIGSGGRTAYVGSHIRPRVMVPKSLGWPVGLSLSTEFGFQKRAYSGSTGGIEIRPIIDKEWGNLYISFNPTIEKSFSGEGVGEGFTFSPNLKTSYNFTKVFGLGFEYYGSTGSLFNPMPASQQEHQLYLATDLDFDPDWEFNAGFGHALNKNGDNSVFKIILGRRF
ncbi:MAG TPA: hypothetical protein DIT07_10405 [Sphingobacteriaceae bacterium]|nr:hypothetical protein [Sphingobacteriaceae bacterium]